jgi:hypothetical protein
LTAGERRQPRRDVYRAIVDDYDPDLPSGSPVPGQPGEFYQHPSADLFVQAARRVDGARVVLVDGTERITKPLSLKARILTVHCSHHDCGHGGVGAHLAEVWRVPGYGLLFRARVAHSRAGRSFTELHDDAVVMVHPGLEAEHGRASGAWTTASWTTRDALAHAWSPKGWEEAPPGVMPRSWYTGRYSVVRDLLDRDDVVHVPLRVSCLRHGPSTVDRDKLLEQVRLATRPRHLRLDAVCAG